ncbi:transcriptional regulator GcvA [Stappia sp.]|jgi:LysR family glycine cleavage system transcriptional activator|uniref:transcriptional regulator GcvA n=1 Tax=Stappia sp. TaxID=1870903 RepID=UPI003D0D980D
MKSGKFPPLNALRAFEASARHLSVKHAAAELCVTPGAVSQMLKVLELHLGTKLFHRINRGILLTEEGQAYLPPIRNAFRQIAEATQRIAGEADTTLTVSVTPFFALTWLVPRLKKFQDAYPDIDLRVLTTGALANFSHDGVDVAVRHGLGLYPGLCSHRILTVEVVPVVAPSLLAERGRPTATASLASWPLVHDAERKAWHLWFQSQSIEETVPSRGSSFDDAGLLLKAVIGGQGVGLLPAALIETELADGRLVQLADSILLDAFAYYLVYPKGNGSRTKIDAFRSWMLNEAAGDVR